MFRPKRCVMAILACCFLDNICLQRNVNLDHDEEELLEAELALNRDDDGGAIGVPVQGRTGGRDARQQIIQQFAQQ